MPRAPSRIGFVCESCQRTASVRQMRRWRGECRRCKGRSWVLTIDYSETEVETSAVGILSSLTLGFGWYSTKTSTNQTTVGGVSAEVGQHLTETRSNVALRVVEYLRLREHQDLRDRGAQPCRKCDVLYVPTSEKPWTETGYCSKSCAAQDGVESAPVFQASEADESKPSMITVACPKGHEFSVLASFSGCLRPCTTCGEKVAVP
ncbi:hypothetical protein GC197_03135 [bacterium]|nr:hypothetical protein [bacterium]